MAELELSPAERSSILTEYFRTRQDEGIAYVMCPAAAAPPADAWGPRPWFLFMPDGRGGYVADHAFIEWVRFHRGFAWTMRIPFTILLFVLVWGMHAWRLDREVGWILSGLIFIAAFAGLQLLLSWLYTLPTALKVRRLRYVALPADLAAEIRRIDGTSGLARAMAGVMADAMPTMGWLAGRFAGSGIDRQQAKQLQDAASKIERR